MRQPDGGPSLGLSRGSQTVTVQEQDGAVELTLRPDEEPAPVAGEWTLTISASPSCRSQLPESARTRDYQWVATQNGAGVTWKIVSPTIIDWSHHTVGEFEFGAGRIVGRVLTFVIAGDTADDTSSVPILFEQVGPDTLGIDGLVRAVSSHGVLEGTLDGDMQAYLGRNAFASWPFGPDGICRAPDHRVTMRPR